LAFKNEDVFVTTGPRHFKEWTIDVGGNFKSRAGTFGKNDPRHVGCVFNGSVCLTGNILG